MSSQLSWRKKNGKYVICKEGVYMALSEAQVLQMMELCRVIISNGTKFQKDDARK